MTDETTDMAHTTESTKSSRNVSRRGVVKGVAWSIPAVTVLSAAPAMAASTPTVSLGAGLVHYGNNSAEPNSLNIQIPVTSGTVPAGTVFHLVLESLPGKMPAVVQFTASDASIQVVSQSTRTDASGVVQLVTYQITTEAAWSSTGTYGSASSSTGWGDWFTSNFTEQVMSSGTTVTVSENQNLTMHAVA